MLLGTLGAGVLGNILEKKKWIEQEKDFLELVMVFNEKQGFLIPPHLLANFEI